MESPLTPLFSSRTILNGLMRKTRIKTPAMRIGIGQYIGNSKRRRSNCPRRSGSIISMKRLQKQAWTIRMKDDVVSMAQVRMDRCPMKGQPLILEMYVDVSYIIPFNSFIMHRDTKLRVGTIPQIRTVLSCTFNHPHHSHNHPNLQYFSGVELLVAAFSW